MKFDTAAIRLYNAIESQQSERMRLLRERESRDRANQSTQATVMGHDQASGQSVVSVPGGGTLKVQSLTNASIPVGQSFNVVRQGGAGFLDGVTR